MKIEQRSTDSVELIILPDGTVQYEERFGATINSDLDLRRFPFDRQTFDLEIQSFVWDQDQTILVVNEQQLGMNTEFDTPEWTVVGVQALSSINSEIRSFRLLRICIRADYRKQLDQESVGGRLRRSGAKDRPIDAVAASCIRDNCGRIIFASFIVIVKPVQLLWSHNSWINREYHQKIR